MANSRYSNQRRKSLCRCRFAKDIIEKGRGDGDIRGEKFLTGDASKLSSLTCLVSPGSAAWKLAYIGNIGKNIKNCDTTHGSWYRNAE